MDALHPYLRTSDYFQQPDKARESFPRLWLPGLYVRPTSAIAGRRQAADVPERYSSGDRVSWRCVGGNEFLCKARGDGLVTYEDIHVRSPRRRLWGDDLRQVAASMTQPVSAVAAADDHLSLPATASHHWDYFAKLAEVGVAIVDHSGKCVTCNELARDVLERHDGLLMAHSTIVALTPGDRHLFKAALEIALQAEPGDAARAVSVLALHRLGQTPLTVAITPIPAVEEGGEGSAMLIIVDPDRNIEETVRVVCRLYHLTDAESRLAQHLVNGWTIAEAADLMTIKVATARAYLKQIFAKTGINRQSSLIRLLLTSRVPLMLGGTDRFQRI